MNAMTIFRVLRSFGPGLLLGVNCTAAPQPHPPTLPMSRSGAVVCESYLKTVADDSHPAAVEACVGLSERWRRVCREGGKPGPHDLAAGACFGELLRLVDAPECHVQAMAALCSTSLPAVTCGEQRLGTAVRSDLSGEITIVVKDEVSSYAPVGVVALGVDGTGVLVISMEAPGRSAGHARGSVGTFHGKLQPGTHSIQMFVNLPSNGAFERMATMEQRCINVRAGESVTMIARLDDSVDPLSVMIPVAVRLDVE